jgi:AmmeMemoRadiSam system protein A
MAMIVAADRRRLLHLARHALSARVRGNSAPEAPPDLNRPTFGVFVTVYHRDELRGCLGTLEGREPLAAAVVRLGGDVAHRDHRFEPIASHELDHVVIDLSVLTAPEPVHDVAHIVIGRHGLIVEQGLRRGLLLPQVAREHGWDRETLLARTCDKAGLAPDAWKNGASLFRFEAEVFGECDELGDWNP